MDEEMRERLVRVEARCKSNTHRLDKLEALADAIHEQGETLAKMLTELTHTNSSLKDLNDRVGNLETRPGKLWDKLWGAAVGAIGSGLMVALLTLILK